MVLLLRGSSEQISSANRLVVALASSVESEQARKRSSVAQPSRGGHVPARCIRNPGPGGRDGRKTRAEPSDVDTCCQSVVAHDTTVAAGVDDVDGTLEPMSPASTSGALPSSVKEYSLFDNHFSRAVENVLRNDLLGASQWAHATALPAAVDEALLAKAPGYRALTASPGGGCGRLFHAVVERPRKYSNDSTGSSVSSVRSCEDSGVASNGRVLPPATTTIGGSRTGHQPEMVSDMPRGVDMPSRGPELPPAAPRGSPFHHPAHHDLASKIPARAPFADFCYPAAESVGDAVGSAAGVGPASTNPLTSSVHYSSPNEPMTLPRISTDLNPYAPDFVFRPAAAVTASGLGSTSVVAQADDVSITASAVPATTAAAAAGLLTAAVEAPAASAVGGWNGAVMGDGKMSVATTAFSISVPMVALDMSPGGAGCQWATVPTSALLQDSLTFG